VIRLPSLRHAVGAWPLAIVLAAGAAGTCADFLNALAQRESSKNAQAQNRYGYVGLFQMGEAALIDAGFYRSDGTGANDWRGSWTGAGGITSLRDFMDHPEAQVAAVTAYHQRLWTTIQRRGLDRYLGQSIAGVEMTRSGMIAAAHLVGAGNLAAFLRSGGKAVPRDGNGTTLTEYVSRFGGYELTGAAGNCSDFANGTPTAGTSMAGNPLAPSPGMPNSPYAGLTMEEAFHRAAGLSSQDVAWTVRAALAGLLLLTSAASLWHGWAVFAAGRSSTARLLRVCQGLAFVLLAMSAAFL
jgi:hypothetical protein